MLHTSAYVRIRQHTSAYVSIRPHRICQRYACCLRPHTSAYVSIRQHTSAYDPIGFAGDMHAAYVRIRQHTSAYVSIRQHTTPSDLPAICMLQRLLRQFLYCCASKASKLSKLEYPIRSWRSLKTDATPAHSFCVSICAFCTNFCVSICAFVLVKQVN